jgi:hypothetical protein
LIGDTLDEYVLLSFPVMEQAYYVVCSHCSEEPNLAVVWQQQSDYHRDLLKKANEEQNVEVEEGQAETETAAPSLTDAVTTTYGSEVSTPAEFSAQFSFPSALDIKANSTLKVVNSASAKKPKERIYSFAEINDFMDKNNRELVTSGSRKRKVVDRSITPGTKRTFKDLIDEFDNEDREPRKKGARGSFGGL